jgi:putative aminopeptidase FrvX
VTAPLAIAEALLSVPTVPFIEDLPAQFCRDFAAERGITSWDDAAGNVVLQSGEGPAPLVLVAHLDHPGFAVDGIDGDTLALTFRGGLRPSGDITGTPVDVFRRGERDACGRAELTSVVLAESGALQSATAALVSGDPGDFGMWGFPGWSIEDGKVTARLCDDLLGVAAALACLDAVREPATPLWGLFTRGEEEGLLGAFEAARLGTVPGDATIISLECSKALPEAPQGAGVIVRVGDLTSVFDNTVVEALRTAAQDAGVTFRRKLMDGGTCEATVFCALGYRAAGLATPLGNYHNAADDGRGIAPETVLVDDWLAEVDLLIALARGGVPAPGEGLPPALAARAEKARQLLGADGA